MHIALAAFCLAISLCLLASAEIKRRKRLPFTFMDMAFPIAILVLVDVLDLISAIARS